MFFFRISYCTRNYACFEKEAKGLVKLVAVTLLWRQMFPSLAARETYVAETNFAARKQKMFSPEVKNIFVSRTKLLRTQHMFPSLATMKTMLVSFQCRSLIKKCFLATMGGLQPFFAFLLSQSLSGPIFLIPSPSSSKQCHTQSSFFFLPSNAMLHLHALRVALGTRKCKLLRK